MDGDVSINDIRDRYNKEVLDVSTDITATLHATQDGDGIALTFVDYPVHATLEHESGSLTLEALAAALHLSVADLAHFTASVNISMTPGVDEEENRLDDTLFVSVFYDDEDYFAYGFAERNDGGAWSLDSLARTFAIDPDKRIWDATEA